MFGNIALVTPHTLSHRTAEETLALGYLASILRKNGHKVTVVDGWLRGIGPAQIVDSIAQQGKPNVICISCYRSNLNQSKELLGAIAKKFGNVPVVCGGYGPTFQDIDFLKAGFFVAVRGEAEHMINSLVKKIMLGSSLSGIPGITFRQGDQIIRTNRIEPVQDLDQIPFPARDEIGFVLKRKNPVHVCTSRGCQAHCSFCSIFAFALGASKKRRWRYRSTQNIVDELQCLYEQFGVSHIKFVDDSFIEPPRDERWTSEFLEEIQKRNLSLRFRTQVRADRLNETIVASLKHAGWFATSIGIENASESALKRMRKSASPEDNWRALELLHKHEVYAQVGMILFDESTTLGELEENYQFLNHHKWIVTKGIFTEMFAAEGTPYTQRLSRKNLLRFESHQQNRCYDVQNPQAKRVYEMLKVWHKSHSYTYDWIIDAITAPKVLPDYGYFRVHQLCQKLVMCDVVMFRKILDHVNTETPEKDCDMIRSEIDKHSNFYTSILSRIQKIYAQYGLVYDGIPNPFLTLDRGGSNERCAN